ncbi:hypothetical protein, conserved [Trypanosoma cruzi]|uniref:Leucine-rich repeat protein (LRRP) n=1 Tax=Trypanosoma cruzi (strain CL Brener) TaxID=353153 RepID=Q4DZ05_TRYCC|nr:hypothetical protein, conserved [Trypanosoma cruzi]EAN97754.1 hypothetical protein, conserved [Trypanosoma cruzi]|eukprot:XP_819605.1 hypothetical protein [Trypanosoma cruzi strain CL Brener]
MGCSQSSGRKEVNTNFGATGLHVGRDGDVDLTSRSLDILLPKYIDLIRRDKLHTARRLHLSENRLYNLGKELTLLPDIEELYIDGNRFDRVPAVLGSMENLRLINASMNPLGQQARALDVLPRMEKLTSVILRDCSLSVIPESLLRCPFLKELDLSHNLNMQFAGVEFSALPSLQILRIANCGIRGEIPTGVRGITTLVTLDISGNFFNFDDLDFFGPHLPLTLTELHLRGMHLVAVPQVVVQLRKLSYLDLAENALETLDVLAGRLVRKLGPSSAFFGTAPNVVTEANEDNVSVVSHGSTRIGMSQLSRAGRIANVPQPIPLKRLSLRACDLRTLPKYFHKLTNLVDIDLSENEQLNDPNMTLFSLSNLQVVNIVGCPFAENRNLAHNEWFDIAHLYKLHTINWEVWKGVHNMNPYRTKVPFEICGLQLQYINGIKLRPKLFVGDAVQTIINLLVDGYLKVDLALDDGLVYSYAEATRALNQLESFFFDSSKDDEKHVTGNTQRGRPKMGGNTHFGNGKRSPLPSSLPNKKVRRDALQIAISRYIFFLTMQAANYDAVIVPPADVMAIHYAQMTQDPISYRKDCEAICGQVLNCNYNLFFLEQKMRPQAVKEALVGSRRVWNMIVHTTQKDLFWLRYEFWERRERDFLEKSSSPQNDKTNRNVENRNAFAADDAKAPTTPPSSPSPKTPSPKTPPTAFAAVKVPCAPPYNGADLGNLSNVDAVGDLCSVLDFSITAHFTEQGTDRFVASLVRFFSVNKRFLDCAESIAGQHLDWTRYVKYLALYAQIQRLKQPKQQEKRVSQLEMASGNNSFVSPDAYLPQPMVTEELLPKVPQRQLTRLGLRAGLAYARANSVGTSQRGSIEQSRNDSPVTGRNSDAGGRRLQQGMPMSEPVPTIGISLLLYSHRTLHAKYYQALALLGIETIDIDWDETYDAVEATMRAWMLLYDELYVKDAEGAFCLGDGLNCFHGNDDKKETSQSEPRTAIRRPGSKRVSRLLRRTILCSAGGEHVIF